MRICLVFSCCFQVSIASAQDSETPLPVSKANQSIFDLGLIHDSTRPRAYFGPQLLSLILPGFDQWLEGQWKPALFLSGIAVSSYGVAAALNNPSLLEEDRDSFNSSSDRGRGISLSLQSYSAMGSFSAYASFRSAVQSQKANGKFEFLGEVEEDLGEILLSPFRFDHLLKPTTYVPLLLAGTIVALSDFSSAKGFTPGDAFYSFGFSYFAGTHEEALFRGWLYPVMREQFGSYYLANALQSAAFAAAHLSADLKFFIV